MDWAGAITSAAASRWKPIEAKTFVHKWGTASQPVALICSDGQEHVVKGPQVQRMAVNDHVVARLGHLLGAPIPEICLVNVPDELIKINPQMLPMVAGVGHGSKRVPDVTERVDPIQHLDAGDNRTRFAALAVLYGWIGSNDRQFLYGKADPWAVWSVDHGHFFPGGPNWTVASLAGGGSTGPEPGLKADCKLVAADLAPIKARLSTVTADLIAEIVAGPPDEWGITLAERVALGQYLDSRRVEMLSAI